MLSTLLSRYPLGIPISTSTFFLLYTCYVIYPFISIFREYSCIYVYFFCYLLFLFKYLRIRVYFYCYLQHILSSFLLRYLTGYDLHFFPFYFLLFFSFIYSRYLPGFISLSSRFIQYLWQLRRLWKSTFFFSVDHPVFKIQVSFLFYLHLLTLSPSFYFVILQVYPVFMTASWAVVIFFFLFFS